MNPLLLPSLTFFIGANLGVIIMASLIANSRKEMERRDETVKAWSDNNRRFDGGRSYTFSQAGELVSVNGLKLVKG